MKKLSKMCFSLFLALSLVGCSSSTNTPTATPSSTNPSEGQTKTEPAKPEVKPIQLKASTHTPPGAMTDAFDAFLDEIERRTDGQVKFERFYHGSLAGATDIVDALKNGVADVAVINPSQQSGRLPLGTIASNPAMYENSWSGVKALTELYTTSPELNEEMAKVGVQAVGHYSVPPFYIMSVKPVSKFEDLKGLRILTSSRPITALIADLGATPVGIPFNESYEALSRGTVDGIVIGLQSSTSFGLHELVKTVWKVPVAGGPGLYGMSKKVYDELPENVRTVIEEVRTEFHPDNFYKIYEEEGDPEAWKKFAEKNVQVHEASEADIQFIVDGPAKAIWAHWVKEQEDQGLPGQKIFDSFRSLTDKYNKEFTNR